MKLWKILSPTRLFPHFCGYSGYECSWGGNCGWGRQPTPYTWLPRCAALSGMQCLPLSILAWHHSTRTVMRKHID